MATGAPMPIERVIYTDEWGEPAVAKVMIIAEGPRYFTGRVPVTDQTIYFAKDLVQKRTMVREQAEFIANHTKEPDAPRPGE